MKRELNYSEAYSKLEKLVDELEEGDVPLEKLSSKVEEANLLLALCEGKLRLVEADVNKAINKKADVVAKKKGK